MTALPPCPRPPVLLNKDPPEAGPWPDCSPNRITRAVLAAVYSELQQMVNILGWVSGTFGLMTAGRCACVCVCGGGVTQHARRPLSQQHWLAGELLHGLMVAGLPWFTRHVCINPVAAAGRLPVRAQPGVCHARCGHQGGGEAGGGRRRPGDHGGAVGAAGQQRSGAQAAAQRGPRRAGGGQAVCAPSTTAGARQACSGRQRAGAGQHTAAWRCTSCDTLLAAQQHSWQRQGRGAGSILCQQGAHCSGRARDRRAATGFSCEWRRWP